MCIKSHLRTASWSSGVCLGRQLDVFFYICMSVCSVLFCSVCEKKDSLYHVVTVCSALPSRSPETSLQMEKEAVTSAWSSAELQWLFTEQTEDTGIPCRVWGNGRIRGKLGHAAWVGECIVRSCSGSIYQTAEESSDRTNQSPKQTERFQHQSDWTATRSPTNFPNSHHGSHLDPVRCEAQKCQCQVQSASYAQRWQLRIIIISGKLDSFLWMFLFFFKLFIC